MNSGKGNMDKLIICETDRGRYAVRPMSWAGIWNEKGQIKESLNHLALFIEKEDAEKFTEWKEAQEHYCRGQVVWDEETASFQVTERLSAESYEVLNRGCKVIGNIFDTPEMLEEW